MENKMKFFFTKDGIQTSLIKLKTERLQPCKKDWIKKEKEGPLDTNLNFGREDTLG
jgi:hypothetical protein